MEKTEIIKIIDKNITTDRDGCLEYVDDAANEILALHSQKVAELTRENEELKTNVTSQLIKITNLKSDNSRLTKALEDLEKENKKYRDQLGFNKAFEGFT